VHSHAIDAFASINVPAIGTISGNTIVRSGLATSPRTAKPLRLTTAVDRNAILIKLTPAVTPESLARQLQGMSGAVLEGTGVGHIRTDLQGVVSEFGKPTVISTQTLYGGERLGQYDVDRDILAIPNVIPAGDMNSDCALVKLMWALGQGGDVRPIIRTDLAGEISVQIRGDL
jgi:L-asparaginase/Glu-tRNA(Gln) amidotransferase subunit D